ncbi:MAG TPA: hypothetical protein VHF91_09750 [Acidimicrobiales bacterium]|nr:hypothetical protein [Acidimicrobiales bacterium]
MRRITGGIAALLFIAFLGLAAAGPASAATPSDKPVVTVGRLTVRDSGGVSPDTWRTYVTIPVGGYNFTPGAWVYVTFQNLSDGTPPVSGEWITAGTGPCGFECNNYGKINYTRTIGFEYRTVCGDWLRVLAWDHTKSPQPGYGWSYRDVLVSC